MELEGKVAIVTGASLGIGSACALDLARNGANVAINYRKHDAEARAICDQINAMGRRGLAVRADVASFADAQAMVATVVKEFGRVDILINNAGVNGPVAPVWEYPPEAWDRVLEQKRLAIFGRADSAQYKRDLADFATAQEAAGKNSLSLHARFAQGFNQTISQIVLVFPWGCLCKSLKGKVWVDSQHLCGIPGIVSALDVAS